MSKTKKWFIKVRGSYLPESWQGWLTYIPYLAYIIGVLVFVIRRKDSGWLALFTVLPNWIAAAVILTWVARRKS
jgi:hypothetical protein